jgi:hypothetical protein
VTADQASLKEEGVRMSNGTFEKIAKNHFVKIIVKNTYGESLCQKT